MNQTATTHTNDCVRQRAKFGARSKAGDVCSCGGDTATYSDTVQQAFRDWNEHRAYVKSGNYRVKVDGSVSGPIASWNKEVKRLFPSCKEFHAAAQAFREGMAMMNQTTAKAAKDRDCDYGHPAACECGFRSAYEQQPPDPPEPSCADTGDEWRADRINGGDIVIRSEKRLIAYLATTDKEANAQRILQAVQNQASLIAALERVERAYNTYADQPAKLVVEMTAVMAHVENALEQVREQG